MLDKLRILLRSNIFLRKFIGYYVASSGLFDSYFKKYALSDAWNERVKDVLSSTDLNRIVKVKDAGVINNGTQTMHNGLKIFNGSYYGPEYAQLLMQSNGVHEPQEEYVFQEVLNTIKEGSTMIELGSFWAFYSMWFQQKVLDAKCFMVEPDTFNIGQGKRNFKLNGFKGDFTQAFVGSISNGGTPPTINLDDFVEKKKIQFVDILHSDIQGFEYEMLLGAIKTIDAGRIGYIFISTHSETVHLQCIQFLLSKKFEIIAEADMKATYSEDGLIAAIAPHYPGIRSLTISKKKA